jgi:FtsP/CotA-like multicopper oxidase with cupredoxin domain
LFLINGKPATDPDVLTAKPGQKVRLRVINAASDTIFTVALGGHRMTITHTDGHAVQPAEVDAFYIGMGERYDAIVTLGRRVPARGPTVRQDQRRPGRGLVRTGSGAGTRPRGHAELSCQGRS